MIRQLFSRIALNLKIRAGLHSVRANRQRQVRLLLRSAKTVHAKCPICGANKIVEFLFPRPNDTVEKQFCRSCEHLFTDFVQSDPEVASGLFRVGEENAGKETQVDLLNEVVTWSGVAAGRYLDFGVGGNLSAFNEVAQVNPQHTFMGCDVYPADVGGYFTTYDSDAPLGSFDGISSYAVIEHLTGTLGTWRLLNRLLKPMSKGGGWMVHSFPSQLHHDMDHWAIQIRTHTCLFSRPSLALTCSISGFEFVKGNLPRSVGPHYHPVLVFRKTRDV